MKRLPLFLALLVLCVALPHQAPISYATATIPPPTPTPRRVYTPTRQPPSPTPTFAPTPTVSPPTATATPVTYTVREGDMLGAIAARFGVSVPALAWVNRLPNPDYILPGQILTIPDAALVPPIPTPGTTTGKLIVVELSTQQVFTYEDGALVRTFLVSTGKAAWPTVTGDYTIEAKLELDRMTGPGYDLPNVPWVMYFYQGYSFHGTYWHSNFGTPMSHGCVNMRTDEAEWLYRWAPLGTAVHIAP